MSPVERRKPADVAVAPGTKPSHDVFISHASEDKDSFARPLAVALRAGGLDVWFDEFELIPGRSLRRSLDDGLAGSRYGVVIFSPAFFGKKWPEYELDGMVQLLGDGRLIPIWHGVDADDVKRYSAPLADKIAIPSSRGIDHAVRELIRTIGELERPALPHATSATPIAATRALLAAESPSETCSRARALIQSGRGVLNRLIVAVACAPRQESLRPKQFGDSALASP
jgi:hypothetical protein